MGTPDKQKQAKVTTKSPPSPTRYFSMRIENESFARLENIAEVETKKAFQPIHIVSIMRKFIREGIERWEKENG